MIHGGLDEGELRSLGLRPEQVLDFSANINPLGPSPAVSRAAAQANLAAYPDRHSLALREALAEKLGVGIDNLIVGNGSTELIHLLARAYLGPRITSLIFAPTFGEYETAAALTGANICHIHADEAQGFRWSLDEAVKTIEQTRPALVFLCNPNNPTGVYLERGDVEKIHGALSGDSLLVLDDAYSSLADRAWDPIPLLRKGNIVILRSMTKEHAVAGVRLGYMVAEPHVISRVRRLQPAWSVNAVAQAVGLAALNDDVHVAAARKIIAEAKEYLSGQLAALGIPVTVSAANFLLAKVGAASEVRQELLRRRIAVRDCASFGLPEQIRVAVRRREDCDKLIESLREVLGRE
ncbi:MAG: histidinol-phosphate aminotransferase family protein [Dehalococcoidia bacterium]|nr:histidinol-phosphate aminotransferase family protein [Dehalococcoidia bacterium]